jgi:antitoxin ParD1/3/4
MNVSLTQTLEAYAREKVESGRYNDTSEVVSEALRMMMDRDEQMQMLKEEVTKGFEQINRGKFTTIHSSEDFVQLARKRR